MPHIALLALDLDGTLLRSDQTLSARTMRALERCRAAGMRVAIATGRSMTTAVPYAKIIRPDALIVHGGALAAAGDKVLLSRRMPAELTDSLTAACFRAGADIVTVETPEGCFVNREAPPLPPDYAHAVPRDLHMPLGLDAYELTASFPNRASAERVAAAFTACEPVGFAGERFVRFALRGADKREAAEAVAAHFSISMEETVAFGDDYNDIYLLRACGMGVAMANAADEIKAAADETTAANDADGVACWLESNVLSGGEKRT